MARPFEVDRQLEVAAAPEQAWDAITTGDGMDGWFMGRNEITPGVGGKVRTVSPAFTEEATITAWEPPTRFAYRGDELEDGTVHQFEYQIEPRPNGSSIRWLHTGVLGPDWESTYEAMNEGDPMYFQKLAEYLTYFYPRKATVVDAFGPNIPDQERVWATLRPALGLPGPVKTDERVRLTPEGLEVVDGVVDWVSPSMLGVRTDDGLYRFIHGFEGTVMVGHHIYVPGLDQKEQQEAWSSWMNRVFA
ncbi:MAG TPA: SRPBCC domain-containing protein [Actinomycetota bacterium]|nr:SRPBCC domain-containing protein [Actinomycetota bacterium]